MASALQAGETALAGEILVAGHRSLRDDYEVSTEAIDGAIDALLATPGVLGARMTGGGFGGSVVVFAEPEAAVDGWSVRPSDGALTVRDRRRG
jgi:galactokinase